MKPGVLHMRKSQPSYRSSYPCRQQWGRNEYSIVYCAIGIDLINGRKRRKRKEERYIRMMTQKKGEEEERKEDGDGHNYEQR